MTWLLLIYTVPPEPTRKRAFIWREVKKAGAVYVRDGVCALPESAQTRQSLKAICTKVAEMGGQAILAQTLDLDAERSQALQCQIQDARALEYAEVTHEATQFLEHLQREHQHRDFRFSELEELEQDLGKLKRWVAQIGARDYFEAARGAQVAELLSRCEEALAGFLEQTYAQEHLP